MIDIKINHPKPLERKMTIIHDHGLFEQIDIIIERFNFERVHKAMVALNWGWRGKGVPDVQWMKDTARELLVLAVQGYEDQKIGYSATTGGFTAGVETFADASPRLSLRFAIDEQESSVE